MDGNWNAVGCRLVGKRLGGLVLLREKNNNDEKALGPLQVVVVQDDNEKDTLVRCHHCKKREPEM